MVPMTGAATLALLFLMAVPARAGLVHVDADGRLGQGFTAWRGEECFVVVPDHVVRADVVPQRLPADTITLTGPENAKGTAEFEAAWAPDFASLRVTSNVSLLCGPQAEIPDSHRDGFVLVLREADGRITYLPLSLVAEATQAQSFVFRPTDPRDRLRRGMSGASVFQDRRRQSVLTRVSSDSSEGIAFDLGYMARAIGPWIGDSVPAHGEDRFPLQTELTRRCDMHRNASYNPFASPIIVRGLPPATMVIVLAVGENTNWRRVRLRDGRVGFIRNTCLRNSG